MGVFLFFIYLLCSFVLYKGLHYTSDCFKITYVLYVRVVILGVLSRHSSIYRILIRVTTQSRTKTPAAISQDCRLGRSSGEIQNSPYCHVEPVETSSRKAHILLILFATLDPSTALRMTGRDTHTRFEIIGSIQNSPCHPVNAKRSNLLARVA